MLGDSENKEKSESVFKHKDKGAHYRYSYKGVKLDPVRISLIYEINHPSQAGALKKILCAGKRGKKTLVEDIEDIITSCERWLETIAEDADQNNNQ